MPRYTSKGAAVMYHECGQALLVKIYRTAGGGKWTHRIFWNVDDPQGAAIRYCPKCGKWPDGDDLTEYPRLEPEPAPAAKAGAVSAELQDVARKAIAAGHGDQVHYLACALILEDLAKAAEWSLQDEKQLGLICSMIRKGKTGAFRAELIATITALLLGKEPDPRLDRDVWGFIDGLQL